MVDDIESGGEIEQEGSRELCLLGGSQPKILEMSKGSGSGMISEKAVVVLVENVVLTEVVVDLIVHSAFYNFPQLYNVGYRAIVSTV